MEGADAAEEALVEEEDDIGDLMAEILAEETRKKEELAAALKRDAEEAKKKCVDVGWCVWGGVWRSLSLSDCFLRGAHF